MGFTEILTLVFVILKGTGHLNWSWWVVFSPELAAGAVYLMMLLVTLVGVLAVGKKVRL